MTFYSLKEDVEVLLCGRGSVYTLIPPGVDPHEYQLSVSDVEVVERADLIVSTGHTHFELELRELVMKGELKARLLDVIYDVPLVLRVNPVTGMPNYHMPIRDPYNYVSFIISLAGHLAEIDPTRAECYYKRAVETSKRVFELVSPLAGKFGGDVIVDKPHAQYIASWLGFNVVLILKYEEEVPVSPDNVEKAINLIRNKQVVAVFLTSPLDSKEASLLVEEARANGVKAFEVPSPHTTGALAAFESIVSSISGASLGDAVTRREHSTEHHLPSLVLVFLLGFLSGVSTPILIAWLRGRRS